MTQAPPAPMDPDPDENLKLPGDQPASPRSNAFDPEAEALFVERVMRRDPDAMDELTRRIAFVPRILAYLNSRRGRPLNDDELRDVAQDVYGVLLTRIGDYKPLAPLESWIAGICERQLYEAIRKKHKRANTTSLESEPLAREAGAERSILDSAEAQRLLASLGKLEAQILTLKHFEGRTFPEIAARLKISENTAKTMHYRALARLRAMVENERRQREEES